MFSNRLYSPLRYPGGKSRFAPFISELMKINDLVGGHYLEPYAGGAGVALDVLFHNVASHVHINDLDPALASFWNAAYSHIVLEYFKFKPFIVPIAIIIDFL